MPLANELCYLIFKKNKDRTGPIKTKQGPNPYLSWNWSTRRRGSHLDLKAHSSLYRVEPARPETKKDHPDHRHSQPRANSLQVWETKWVEKKYILLSTFKKKLPYFFISWKSKKTDYASSATYRWKLKFMLGLLNCAKNYTSTINNSLCRLP